MPHLTSCHDWILTPTQIRKLKTSQTKRVPNPSTHSNLRYHQNSIVFSFEIRAINKQERRFARSLHQLLYLHSKFPHPSLNCSSYALHRSGDAIYILFSWAAILFWRQNRYWFTKLEAIFISEGCQDWSTTNTCWDNGFLCTLTVSRSSILHMQHKYGLPFAILLYRVVLFSLMIFINDLSAFVCIHAFVYTGILNTAYLYI